ncbi:glycosyltransferase [Actinoplanes sp. LDG1-06]|uniref:Glycosyltransferase n=1 Tax=Paractinoplanes ovalisporus TaxID=2810368 RepID=A0ABS2A7V8_9ACTN|nr:glycosyltransferase [Actinoplanes ovalisporus]MBM2615933.1 glycosyltransferase [Actinoplanes ovalisporus]
MRIAHFCDSFAGRPDGVSRSAALTVGLLRAAGFEVDFYEPGRVRSVPLPGRQLRVASPWFRCEPADVVHVHTCGPIGMTGFRMAERWRVPLVVTWHTDLVAYGDTFPEIPIGASWCAWRLRLGWTPSEFLELARAGPARRARLVVLGQGMFARMAVAIAPSDKTAAGFREFATAAGLPRICVLPTPVEAAEPREPGRRGDVVLSVGRATAEKNPALLLDAFGLLRRDRPGARLVLLGVRQGRAGLARRIAAAGLAGHVDVLPPVPREEVAIHYRAADVLAFASTTDTQSLVLAEAEAIGLPVVVADPALGSRPGGGPPRFTCAPTAPALAAALDRMLDDDDLRTRVVAEGLTATRAYPPEVYLARLAELYRTTIGS